MDPMLQGQMKEWVIMICGWGLIAFSAFLAASALRRAQKNAMQKHMLEKFSTAQDFAAFVQSPAGQKYMESFTDAVTTPMNSIFNSVKVGFVLMCAGIGFLAGAPGANGLTFRIGWVAFTSGVGFLCAAAVSYFLARKIRLREKE